MRRVGRGLQILALTLLPLAILLELTSGLDDTFGLRHMLIMMLFGIVAFVLGRVLEGYAGSGG